MSSCRSLRGGIVGMMEAGWSARRVARQLGRSDCVNIVFGTTGSERCHLHEYQVQKTPSTDQSSRRPPHRRKYTRTANCFICCHPGPGSTFIRGPCVF
ncbi:uncharacterized protein TNCV_3648411 [Trichonephila clavipes]|nr:uncharacterized protein TNCV_3648411 [Trichonephila clavipes]